MLIGSLGDSAKNHEHTDQPKGEQNAPARRRGIACLHSKSVAQRGCARSFGHNMKFLFLYLLAISASFAQGSTFKDITDAFPLGTAKQGIQQKEPDAKLVPCMASPIDTSARKECLFLLKRSERLGVVYYFVNDKLAAMVLSRLAVPGKAETDQKELEFIRSRKKLSSFSALRIDQVVNPKEVNVDRFALDAPSQVALLVSSDRGSELWVVDEHIFNPKSFFLLPTPENKNKVIQTKEAIDEQRKSFEATKKTEPNAAH